MKSTRLSSIAVLGVAVCLTAGSLYISAKAATSQQEDASQQVADVEATNDAPVAEAPAEIVAVAEETAQDIDSQVRLDADGGFQGRLSALSRPNGAMDPAGNMTVRILSGGGIVQESTTNEEGVFSFTGLKPGTVGLLAFGDEGFSLYGLKLVASDDSDVLPVSLESGEILDLSVDTAIVSGVDVPTAKRLLLSGLPSAGAASSEAAKPAAGGSASSTLAHDPVQLQADGSLRGNVNLMRSGGVRDLTIHFIRNGEHVAAADVEANGDFQVVGLAPGVHSVVAVGADGTAAIGIDVISSLASVSTEHSRYQTVSMKLALNLAMTPAGPDSFNSDNAADVSNGDLDPADPGTGEAPPGTPPGAAPPAAPGGGGTTTGGGGGGSGGGGGGGLGTLLGVGAGAAIGAALADDDDNRAGSPSI